MNEREILLRALFESREEGTDSDEEEEMDDDELNEIFARNDDKLTLFKKIDREKESPYGKGKKLPRLISCQMFIRKRVSCCVRLSNKRKFS